MSLCLPYAHLSLRRNPFRDLPLEARRALAVIDVDQWVERLSGPRFALQFRDRLGSGKTTHLLALRVRFPEAPHYRFAEGAPIPGIVASPVREREQQAGLERHRPGRDTRKGGVVEVVPSRSGLTTAARLPRFSRQTGYNIVGT